MKKTLFILATAFCFMANAQTPALQWVKGYGGTAHDIGVSTAKDAAGNLFTVGYFNGTADFDPGPATTNLTSAGYEDVFISKFDSSGNFKWAKRIGGTNSDLGQSIALDAAGNIYTVGYFYGTCDFDPGTGTAYITSISSTPDIFVSKLDTGGNYVWAKRMGGSSYDFGSCVAVDAANNVYALGYYSGTADLNPGTGVASYTAVGGDDICVTKLTAAGNFVWATSVGGTGDDYVLGIAVDAACNIFTTGYFSGVVDFDPHAGIDSLYSAGSTDIFVNKSDSAGNFIWAKGMGGISTDAGNSIKLDAVGNVYTCGKYNATVDFDPGAGTANLVSNGTYDIFVSKLNASGNYVWAKSMGGTLADYGASIALDASGNVYTTGSFQGTADFDPGAGTANFTAFGNADIFVSKLDASGNYLWAEKMGGISNESGNDIKTDAHEGIILSGSYQGICDFDPNTGVVNLTSAGGDDVFILKMNQSSTNSIRTYINEQELVNIYPNPSSGNFFIETSSIEKQTVQMFDINGKVVLSQSINGKTNLDVSDLNQGIYNISIIRNEGVINKRVIIVR